MWLLYKAWNIHFSFLLTNCKFPNLDHIWYSNSVKQLNGPVNQEFQIVLFSRDRSDGPEMGEWLSMVHLCAWLGCPLTLLAKRGALAGNPMSRAVAIHSSNALASHSCFPEKFKVPGRNTSEELTCMLLSHWALPSSRESRTVLLGSSAVESFPLTT